MSSLLPCRQTGISLSGAILLLLAIAGLVGCSAFQPVGKGGGEMVNSEDLFVFERAEPEDCSIEVDVGRRAERPISRFLLGKFSEHLGANIYGGMWAQILGNPGMNPASMVRTSPASITQLGEGLTRRQGVEGFVEAIDRGVALGWLPEGRGKVRYGYERKNPLSPPYAQTLTIGEMESPSVGLRQPIHLPLHRTRDYELALHARAVGKGRPPLIASIRRLDTGEVLAHAELGTPGMEWRRFGAAFNLPDLPRETPVELVVAATDAGDIVLDEITLFPADHVEGFDPDVVAMLREARLPLLRWPGGNFVSQYDWLDGVGPAERRPTRLNGAWNILEPNHVGTDEFMAFCRAVGCEPLICVNAGTATPEAAACWVEYCNGSTETRFGAMRARNGRAEPYNVKYWEIGNEIYGRWQAGHCTAKEYAERYRAFHEAMTAVDPDLLLIANGQGTNWNEPLIERNGDILRSVSLHKLPGGSAQESLSPEEAFVSAMASTWKFTDDLAELREQMAKKIDSPRLALTELQLFVRNKPSQPYPTNKTLAEALFFSGMLHASVRQGDFVEMITHSATVNHGGGLSKRGETVWANPVHWAHVLYGAQDCLTPARVVVRAPCFDTPRRGGLPAVEGAPYLDALALTDPKGRRCSLFVASRHPSRPLTATVRLGGLESATRVDIARLAGESYVTANTLDEPEAVRIEKSEIDADGGTFTLEFPPHSLTRLEASVD
jgi:alpha-N-arabinofuranosidase